MSNQIRYKSEKNSTRSNSKDDRSLLNRSDERLLREFSSSSITQYRVV